MINVLVGKYEINVINSINNIININIKKKVDYPNSEAKRRKYK